MTAYEKALERLNEHRASVESLKPALELLESIRDEIRPDAEVEVNTLGYDRANMEVHVNSLNEVVPILRRIRAAGYTMAHHCDCVESRTRLYCFGPIRVDAKLVGSSCRFEKVGVKETPVYKVVCDGADDLPLELHSFDAEVSQ